MSSLCTCPAAFELLEGREKFPSAEAHLSFPLAQEGNGSSGDRAMFAKTRMLQLEVSTSARANREVVTAMTDELWQQQYGISVKLIGLCEYWSITIG